MKGLSPFLFYRPFSFFCFVSHCTVCPLSAELCSSEEALMFIWPQQDTPQHIDTPSDILTRTDTHTHFHSEVTAVPTAPTVLVQSINLDTECSCTKTVISNKTKQLSCPRASLNCWTDACKKVMQVIQNESFCFGSIFLFCDFLFAGKWKASKYVYTVFASNPLKSVRTKWGECSILLYCSDPAMRSSVQVPVDRYY